MRTTKNERIYELESKVETMQIQIKSLMASAHDSTVRLIALEPDNPFNPKNINRGSELTGSDLCRAMLERGDVCVPCVTAWNSDAEAIEENEVWLVHEFRPEEPNFHAGLEDFYFAVPINTRTGEPLTAADVGITK